MEVLQYYLQFSNIEFAIYMLFFALCLLIEKVGSSYL